MTPGGAVVIGGVLVAGVTSGCVVADWKTIGPELAELRDEMLSGLDTAWHARTGDPTRSACSRRRSAFRRAKTGGAAFARSGIAGRD